MRRATVLSGVLALLAGVAAGAIRVEVVRGEGSNNNAAQGSSISPVVRVTDESGNPVRDALVVFEAPTSGPSIDFGGAGPSAHGLSSETGVVAAPTVRPITGDGPVDIRVTASHAGQFANAVIHQMNLGVSGGPARAQELDVVLIPRASPSDKTFTVRVEDGDGHPAPLASVLLVLRRVAGGKAEELDRQQGPTAENGQLTGEFAKLSAGGTLEFMVRADFDGRRATRYFPAR